MAQLIEFPKRKDAEKAVMQLRVDVNDGRHVSVASEQA